MENLDLDSFLHVDMQMVQEMALIWLKLFVKYNYHLCVLIVGQLENILEFQLNTNFTKLLFVLLLYIQFLLMVQLLRVLYSWLSFLIKICLGVGISLALLNWAQVK